MMAFGSKIKRFSMLQHELKLRKFPLPIQSNRNFNLKTTAPIFWQRYDTFIGYKMYTTFSLQSTRDL